jgi:PAS domain S-box-containing protein
MKLDLSLSLKVRVLAALPLVGLCLCLAWLYQLQIESEQALERTLHANQVVNGLVHLRGEMYRVLTMAGGEKSTYHGNEETARSQVSVLERDYTMLSRLTRSDDPKLHEDLEDSRREAVAGFDRLLDIKKSMESNPGDTDGRSLMWREVRTHMYNVLRKDFSKASQEQVNISVLNTSIQFQKREMQRKVLIGFVFFIFVLFLFMLVYLTRGLTLRLAKLSDNAYRLASNRELNPVMRGSDEIAKLDQTFHQMARTIKETSRKERAVVANARDSIFSLTDNFKFSNANPACERLLGVSEKDLIGQALVNFVPPSEAEKVRLFFEALKTQPVDAGNAMELELSRQSGSPVYVLLSAHWSVSEKAYFVVVHDVTDRRLAEQLRQEVVVMVTHDLRTPLATLENILKFLRTGNFGQLDPKGAEYVMVANRNVERMANLVNDLLDIEKVKSGLVTLDKQAFELVDCFTAARELAGGLAEEAGVTIEVVPTDLMIEADQDRVTRVLANLIANAIKFSPQGGTVRVAAKREGNWVYTAVDDQGPGIPPEQLKRIFERFRQVGSETAGKGGSGLGLTICQAIVELHGGKIWVENLAAGGSRFIFSLAAVD